MNCPYCGSDLPQNSKFCRYCGANVQTAPQLKPMPKPAPEPKPIPNPIQKPVPQPKPAPKPGTGRSTAWLIVLAVLLAAALGLNAYQYLQSRKSAGENEQLSSEAADSAQTLRQSEKELENAQKRAENAETRAELAESRAGELEQELADTTAQLEKVSASYERLAASAAPWDEIADAYAAELVNADAKSEAFDALVDFANGHNPGGSSDIFRISEAVVVMKTSDAPRSVLLTTDFNPNSIVRRELDGDAADVAFTEDKWDSSTPMTVTPKHAGTTVVTFSNTYNKQTFTMLVIVFDD